MEKLEVMALIANEFIKGAASTVVVNKSADSAMNKGRGANRNPFMGRVIICKEYSGFVMGTDYSNSIGNTADRMGNSDAEVNLKSVWHKPTNVYGEWFSTDKATETKVYLKLQRNEQQKGFKTETTYYLDGHQASDEEVAAIEVWLKKKSNTQSSTQVELGIDKSHEQHFILPQLDTITLIKQGDKKIEPYTLMHEEYAVAVAY